MDPENPNLAELTYALATFSTPLTRRISDYLAGYQLGPRGPSQVITDGSAAKLADDTQSTDYWTGPMLPVGHPRYADMQKSLLKSFNFRNIVQEGVEFLADGVGADEADWSLVSDLDAGDGTPLPTEEQALLDEAEQLLTGWWDHRDLPSTLQTLLQTAIAHSRAPLRARIPDRYRDESGKLKLITDPLASLEPLHLVLPEVGLSGVFTDPETLRRVGITQVYYQNSSVWKTEWELTYVTDKGKTILQTIASGGGQVLKSDPMDLGGRLWLFELRYPRPAVTRDVLSNQDAMNVGLTMLSRNTHFAGFAQIYGIGIDPPTDPSGEKVIASGPGTQSFFQPSVSIETVEEQTPTGPVRTTKETAYRGATYGKLDPTDPKAIEAAIHMAEANIYASLRQRFVLMDDKATASGRSREVATGSFLRATARYAAGMEHLIRELLEFALAVSAMIQGQPGKYARLRASVTCHQQIFDPSPEQVAANLSLQQAGIISKQTLQTMAGIADPDAENARIAEEAAPPVSRPPPKTGDNEPPTSN